MTMKSWKSSGNENADTTAPVVSTTFAPFSLSNHLPHELESQENGNYAVPKIIKLTSSPRDLG